MGIKGFSKVFKATRIVKLANLAKQTIAIDAMTEIYRAALGAKTVSTLTDPSGKPTIHISVILANVLEFYRQGIGQIWVFDHNQDPNKDFHNPMKIDELAKRQKRKTEAQEKITSLAQLQDEGPMFSDDEDDANDLGSDTTNLGIDGHNNISNNTNRNTTNVNTTDLLTSINNNTRAITAHPEVKLEEPVMPPDIDVMELTPADINNMKYMNARDKSRYKLNLHTKLMEEYEAALIKYNESYYSINKQTTQDRINSLEKQTFSASKEMINDVKLILNCLNISYVEAPAGFEGEAIASYLNATGLADAVFSGDTDPIAYGANTLLRRNPRDKKIYEYTLSAILKQIEDENPNIESPTIADFRKAAIALGTDAAEKTPGIGEKTVLKKLHTITLTAKQLEAMKEFEKIPNANDVIINNSDKTPFVDSHKNNLIDWLVNERGFTRSRILTQFNKPTALETKTKKKLTVKTKPTSIKSKSAANKSASTKSASDNTSSKAASSKSPSNNTVSDTPDTPAPPTTPTVIKRKSLR